MSQNNYLVQAWMSASFMDQKWGQVRRQSKKDHLQTSTRMASIKTGSLISFFLQSTGGEDYDERHLRLTVRARGPGFPEAGNHVCYNNQNDKTNTKVRRTDLAWSQN